MDVFGDHQLGIPYEPVADLLTRYAARDPRKTAIVDLESGASITFGELDRIVTDIGVYLKDRGIGVLITDHNVRETLSVTDRAYIINEGRIFRTGTPEQLGNDPEVKRVYLGESFTLV